jgi:hypothetical protein
MSLGRRLQHLRRDDIDTSILDGVPSLLSDLLGDLSELLVRSLASPVGLDDLTSVLDYEIGSQVIDRSMVGFTPIERVCCSTPQHKKLRKNQALDAPSSWHG